MVDDDDAKRGVVAKGIGPKRGVVDDVIGRELDAVVFVRFGVQLIVAIVFSPCRFLEVDKGCSGGAPQDGRSSLGDFFRKKWFNDN